jgi:hypothetical protein
MNAHMSLQASRSIWNIDRYINNRRTAQSVGRRLAGLDEQLGRNLPPYTRKSLVHERNKLETILITQYGSDDMINHYTELNRKHINKDVKMKATLPRSGSDEVPSAPKTLKTKLYTRPVLKQQRTQIKKTHVVINPIVSVYQSQPEGISLSNDRRKRTQQVRAFIDRDENKAPIHKDTPPADRELLTFAQTIGYSLNSLTNDEKLIRTKYKNKSIQNTKRRHDRIVNNENLNPHISLTDSEIDDRKFIAIKRQRQRQETDKYIDEQKKYEIEMKKQLILDINENKMEEDYNYEQHKKTSARVIHMNNTTLDDIEAAQESIRPYTIYSYWGEEVTKQMKRLRMIDPTKDKKKYKIDLEFEADAAEDAAEMNVNYKHAISVYNSLEGYKKQLLNVYYDEYNSDSSQNNIINKYNKFMGGLSDRFKNLSTEIVNVREKARTKFLNNVNRV